MLAVLAVLAIFALLAPARADEEECYNFDFGYDVDESDVGYIVALTEEGANNFVYNALELLSQFFSNLVLPEMDFTIDLGLFLVDINLKNTRVNSFLVEAVYFKFMEAAEINEVAAEGIAINLAFDFKLTIKMGIPITDEGWGEIKTSGGNLYADVALTASPDYCPYRIYIQSSDIGVDLGSLSVHFESTLGALYDAIFKAMEEEIVEALNEAIGGMLGEAVITYANQALLRGGTHVSHFEGWLVNSAEDWNDLCTADIRVQGGVHFHNAAISIHYPGYSFANKDTERAHEKPSAPLPMLVNNHDVQLIIDKTVFNSAYHAWSTFHGSYAYEYAGADIADDLDAEELKEVFPGLTDEDAAVDNLRLSFRAVKDPYITEVADTGLYTEFSLQTELKSGEKLLASFLVNVNALGKPALFTLPTEATLNMSSIYLQNKYVNSTIEVSELAEGLEADEEALAGWVKSLCKDYILDTISEIMSTRSMVANNSDYICTVDPVITYSAPNYVALGFTLGRPE